MNIKNIFSVVLLLACTVAPIVAVFAYDNYQTRDITAEILARSPEKGNFFPRLVKVPVGVKARLKIRNVDTVMHGFAIPAFEVDAGEIKAGHAVEVEFTPEKPGKYPFYCTIWCSEHHLQMRGILEVTAAP